MAIRNHMVGVQGPGMSSGNVKLHDAAYVIMTAL